MQANISLFEAIEIVQYLYSKDDAKEICRIIQKEQEFLPESKHRYGHALI
jgi:hypothetical protein